MTRCQVFLLALCMLGGCGPRSAGTERPSSTPQAGAEVDPPRPTPARPSRTLPLGATFGDLVRVVRSLEDAGEGDAQAPCSFRALGPNHWRLEADLAIAVRPLPDASTELGARLRAAPGPVQVLSRWGRLGPADANLNLVAMFSAAPWQGDGVNLVLFFGAEGIVARGTGDRLPEELAGVNDVLTLDLVERIRSLGDGVVMVTAESGMGLGSLIEGLRPLTDAGLRVGLGVLLPPNTRLPEPSIPQPGGESEGLCITAFPELADSEIGEREVSELRGAIQGLQPGLQSCIARAGGGMRSDGRIAVRVRIGMDGRVVESCVVEDEHGVTSLRACVLEQLRGMRLGDANGIVDVEFPLRLRRQSTSESTWLCGP